MWNVQVQSRLGSAGKEGHSWRASFSFQGSLPKRQSKEETKMEGDLGSCVFAPCSIEARQIIVIGRKLNNSSSSNPPLLHPFAYTDDLQLPNANLQT
jgi:hypothetical protein